LKTLGFQGFIFLMFFSVGFLVLTKHSHKLNNPISYTC
jgi:hypothetical protein